jgi:hypothetical protein
MMQRIYTKYILLCFILIGSLTSFAQKLEVGVLVGGSYYYGDIVNELELSTIKGAGGAFIRYHVNERIAIKFFGGYARIGGADSISTSAYQKRRNLSFWADIYEGSAQLEYNFIKDITRGRRLRNRFIPYAFVGVGAFYFNNYAYYSSSTTTTIGLSQLQTEGKPVAQYAVCIPFGIGFRYKVTSHINLGLELGLRYTSTSYIDDVGGSKSYYPSLTLLSKSPYPNQAFIMTDRSKGRDYESEIENNRLARVGQQRGKIAINDIYVIGGLTLGYRIGTSSGGGGGYSGRAIRCPRFY